MPAPLISVHDYEAAAKRALPIADFEFVGGGVDDEKSITRNQQAFEYLALRPRMLTGVQAPDLTTTILGSPVSSPIMIAPMGALAQVNPLAEVATAQAASRLDVLQVVSTGASRTIDEIAKESTGPTWLQQYLFSERSLTLEFAQHAAGLGFRAVCVTLDAGVAAKRERNIRNGYRLPANPVNYAGRDLPPQTWGGNPGAQTGFASLIDRSATWDDLAWFCGESPLPVVVKGVMTGADARLAVEHGAQGVIVSNHGARQLDTTLSTVETLPEAVEAVDGRAEVYLDGGVRRGTDVLKALALGARAVLVGRPVLWGLAVAGADGISGVLGILRDELQTAMSMSGQAAATSIDRDLVARLPAFWSSREGR